MAKNARQKRGVDALENVALLEGADYLMDMEMSNRRNEGDSDGLVDVRVEENYVSFVADLGEHWDPKGLEGEDEEDPMYAMFFEKLTKFCNAYMLDVSKEHGVSFPIIYEVESAPSNMIKRSSRKSHQDNKTRRTHQGDRQVNLSQEKRSLVSKVARFHQGNSIRKEILDMKKEREDSPVLPVPSLTASMIGAPSISSPDACEKSLMIEGEDEGVEIVQPSSRENLLESLREELHENLRKPYDQKEFDDLWDFMSSRKQVRLYRGSRRGGSDKPGPMGQSYLDQYSRLKCEIEKVKSDPRKVLNLLRMLSFYLKNVPNGIPAPWLDTYTKTILPGSATA